MSHNEIAKGLKISRSYFSRLAREGCPTSSIKAARDWIVARTAAIGKAPAPQTLNDARMKKLLLECSILQIRLERESSNAEFLPLPEVLEAVAIFMRFAHLALRARCDTFAETIAACTTPNETIRHLRTLCDEGWATGAVAMAAQTQSTRMGRAIADLILERFPKATDEHLQAWAKSLGFDLGQLTNLPK